MKMSAASEAVWLWKDSSFLVGFCDCEWTLSTNERGHIWLHWWKRCVHLFDSPGWSPPPLH